MVRTRVTPNVREMRENARGERGPHVDRGFRHRGHRDVSRIESFSDAVFGFSVTLLVVSLEVPKSFDDLARVLANFPSFALTFALLARIWYNQYLFFRRYALQDGPTIVLNIALLFVIVFFTYPLKFLFGSLFTGGEIARVVRGAQVAQMYGVFAGGYGAIFAIFALLYRHALRKRDALDLTPLELYDTKISMGVATIHIGLAALSVGIAAVFVARGAYAAAGLGGGLVYATIPFVLLGVRAATRSRRAELASALETQ